MCCLKGIKWSEWVTEMATEILSQTHKINVLHLEEIMFTYE